MTQRLYEVALRMAIVGLILFIAAALLTASEAQEAPPFQIFDDAGFGFVYRDPGSPTGSEVGMFNAYCVRVVERRPKNLVETPFHDETVGMICGGKTSNQTEVDNVSGSLTFPQNILQISRCEETGPLGHASANPKCGPWYDVEIVGRGVR